MIQVKLTYKKTKKRAVEKRRHLADGAIQLATFLNSTKKLKRMGSAKRKMIYLTWE